MTSYHPNEEDICHHVSQLCLAPTQSIVPNSAGLSSSIDGYFESSSIIKNCTYRSTTKELTKRGQVVITIDTLPDEVLLGIFDFCAFEEEWQKLVHVCRRWRCLVLESPRRLNLRLVCTSRKPVNTMLGIWPAFPIIVRDYGPDDEGIEDGLVAALEPNDRVCDINIQVYSKMAFEGLVELMKAPYPSLVHLNLRSFSMRELFIPDSLLGGSAPNLKSLTLKRIAFPALPKLLLSAIGLVCLRLCDICSWNYIPPETIVDCLSSLTRLETLQILYRSAQSFPNRESQHPLPLSRTVLPMLTTLGFKGKHEYLYYIFAHIDAPILAVVKIRFFNPAIFDLSQIAPFIGHAEILEESQHADMHLRNRLLVVSLSPREGTTGGKTLVMSMKCSSSIWRIRHLTLSHQLPFPDFDIEEPLSLALWLDGMPNAKWFDLLRFLPAVENLRISEGLARCLAPALEELVDDRVMEVLPVLRTLLLKTLAPSVEEAFGKFVAARQLAGQPVAVQRWPGEV